MNAYIQKDNTICLPHNEITQNKIRQKLLMQHSLCLIAEGRTFSVLLSLEGTANSMCSEVEGPPPPPSPAYIYL